MLFEKGINGRVRIQPELESEVNLVLYGQTSTVPRLDVGGRPSHTPWVTHQGCEGKRVERFDFALGVSLFKLPCFKASFMDPDGHPNSSTCGHFKFLHLRAVR